MLLYIMFQMFSKIVTLIDYNMYTISYNQTRSIEFLPKVILKPKWVKKLVEATSLPQKQSKGEFENTSDHTDTVPVQRSV